jgi:membrane protein
MKLTSVGKVSAMNLSETGRQAESPAQIPMRGWRQVLQRAIRKSQKNNTALLAAGVAFFAFLALYPALIAVVTLVALVADPSQITQQVQSFTVGLPLAARALISDPLAALARGNSGAQTLGLVASLLLALWSASSGTSSLMTAVNLAYDEQETRGFLKFRAIALLLTLGAIVFLVLTLALIAVVPVVLNAVHLGAAGLVLAQALRWVLLFALITVGLATIYRVAPDRNPPKFRWVSLGSIVAALLWLLGSLGFSLYVNFFSNFNKVYGALAGVIVLLLWLYLTCYSIVLGAEINAEAERQTERDSTVGEPKPMGQRGAVVADTALG